MTSIVNGNEVHDLTCVDLSDWLYDVFQPSLDDHLSLTLMDPSVHISRNLYGTKECLDVVFSVVMLTILGHDRNITNYADIAEVVALLGGDKGFNTFVNKLFEKGTLGASIIEEIEMSIDRQQPYVIIGTKLYFVKLNVKMI